MKIREIIQNDIVEDITLYREIIDDCVNTIKSVKPDYEPNFTFDEFYIRVLNNFDGVDEDISDNEKGIIKKQIKAVLKVALEELKNDEESYNILKEIIKEYLE
jgi:hypothetical protein